MSGPRKSMVPAGMHPYGTGVQFQGGTGVHLDKQLTVGSGIACLSSDPGGTTAKGFALISVVPPAKLYQVGPFNKVHVDTAGSDAAGPQAAKVLDEGNTRVAARVDTANDVAGDAKLDVPKREGNSKTKVEDKSSKASYVTSGYKIAPVVGEQEQVQRKIVVPLKPQDPEAAISLEGSITLRPKDRKVLAPKDTNAHSQRDHVPGTIQPTSTTALG